MCNCARVYHFHWARSRGDKTESEEIENSIVELDDRLNLLRKKYEMLENHECNAEELDLADLDPHAAKKLQ